MKRIIVISIFICSYIAIYSADGFLKSAIKYYNEGHFSDAKTDIDKSFSESKELTKEHWYYKSAIYFRQNNLNDLNESSKSLIEVKSYKLNKEWNNKVTQLESEIITTSYEFTEKYINENKNKEAVAYFEIFYRHTEILYWTDDQIDKSLVIASIMMNYCINEMDTTNLCFETSKNIYKKIINQNPDNWDANYYMGNLLYNQAVIKIKTLDYDTDIFKVDQVQNQCVKIFFSALPYLQKAYEINPNERLIVKSLSEIYSNLNDDKKSEKFKKMLEN